MLSALGLEHLSDLITEAIPASIRDGRSLDLHDDVVFTDARTSTPGEQEALACIRTLADQNEVWRSYIGMGYHGTITPSVILRTVLENPGWYTQYTPYQAEISQGRLQALLNFQTMIADLTAMPIANASLLDEATAAAEAMSMCATQTGRKAFFVATTVIRRPSESSRPARRALASKSSSATSPHSTSSHANSPVCSSSIRRPMAASATTVISPNASTPPAAWSLRRRTRSPSPCSPRPVSGAPTS